MTDETRAIVPAEDNRLSFGQTRLRPQDFVPPRVKVVQQMSKEAQGGKTAVAVPGDLHNTLTGETYGTELNILPILPFMQRVLLVRKERRAAIEEVLGDQLPEGDGLMCRSFDMEQGRGFPGIACETCPLSKWDEVTRKPPLCTETYNVAGMTELGELVILSFQKSSAKIGKRFFSMLRMRPGAPWTSIYTVKTREERNDSGVFFVPDVTVSKERPPSELIRQALTWAEQLQGVQIDVTPEGVDEDAGEPIPAGESPF